MVMHAGALCAPRYELLPLSGALSEVGALPAGSVVTITCSPRHGIERTLNYARTLAGMGYHVVPHIAARLVEDRADLQRIAERLAADAIHEVFIVGGDSPQPQGDYADGLALLEDLVSLSPRPCRIGIPAYPEGHPAIDSGRLQADLRAKSALADYAVTQLCFDGGVMLRWLERERQAGFSLPVYVGLPGAVARRKLLALGLRLGVGPSLRLLRHQTGLLGAAFGSQHYQAEQLLHCLAPAFADLQANLAGLHLFTFNRIAATRDWVAQMSQDLGLSLSGSYNAR